MTVFHLWFILLVGGVFIYLWAKRLRRDAWLFFVLALMSYGLWYGIAMDQPFTITKMIEQGILGVFSVFSPG